MWLRPRVENLPIDLDWWVYAHHHTETVFSWAYAGLNAMYLLLGIAGLCLRPRYWQALLAYMLLRSALLLTVGGARGALHAGVFPHAVCRWAASRCWQRHGCLYFEIGMRPLGSA